MGIKDGAKLVARKAIEVPKATVVGYWRGLAYPFKGLRFVFFEHPGLARFWLPPILLTMLILVGWLVLGWTWHDDIVNAMWEMPTGEGFWVRVLGALHWLLRALVLIVLWALGFVVVVLFTNVIAAPFNDLLSEKVEEIVTGRAGPPFSWKAVARDTARSVVLEGFKLLIYAVVMGAMFLISFVPLVGPVLHAIVGFLFTTIYFAIDYIDWPASRRNRGIHYRFGMVHEHFLPMFGFGTGVWLFLFVPLVNLLFMPAAVAGGTLLFLDLEGEAAQPVRPAEPATRPALEPGPEPSS